MPYAHLASEQPRRPPSAAARFFFAVLALFLFCVFAALGSWQVRRLQWKQDADRPRGSARECACRAGAAARPLVRHFRRFR
jgi:cytochrome oxidase assembly protein ShyY1